MSDTCGCCSGIEERTPEPTANRPGLSALAYRVGTHASFLETMLARLTTHILPDGRRPLQQLTTRSTDDPAIAMLDAWAVVADVLTFYQERIANEGYLRTATERRSVLELARLVGYRLRPGVAASVYLAYEMEPGVDRDTEIPAGSRAQSVPRPGELPQSFETAGPMKARTAWNAIRPRQTQPQLLTRARFEIGGTLYLKGISTNLKPNAPFLLAYTDGPELYRVMEITTDPLLDRTAVRLQPWRVSPATDARATKLRMIAALSDAEPPPAEAKATGGGLDGLVRELERRPAQPPTSSQRVRRELQTAYAPGSEAAARILGTLRPGLAPALYAGWASLPLTGGAVAVEAHILRAQTGVFGATAPRKTILPPAQGGEISYREWDLGFSSGPTFEVDYALETSESGGSDEFDQPNLRRFPVVRVQVGRNSSGRLELELPTYDSSVERTLTLGDERVQLRLSYNSQDMGGYVLEVSFLDRGTTTALPTSGFAAGPLAARVPPTLRIDLSLESGVARFAGTGVTIALTSADSSAGEQEDNDLPSLRAQATGTLPGPSDRERPDVVSLDVPNVAVLPGSYVVVERPSGALEPLVIAKALEVKEIARADYGISGKSTAVTLDRPWLDSNDTFATLRGTTVYAASERLELAEEPITTPVCGGELVLDGLYDGLESGRWLIVAGERHIPGTSGVQATELVMIGGVRHGPAEAATPGASDQAPPRPGDRPHTILTLDGALSYCYVRSSMKIYANIAPATHGETRREIMGAGDGSRALQQFALRFAPLTYVPAATPSGVESTLEVYINDVRWHEARSLAGLGPTDHRFITRQDDAHQTTVIFGTGERGARLPTGRENIRAVYRNGIGKAGNVAAGAITLLSTRSLGVKGVVNPLAASGGADPEGRDQARENVPLAVTALDRLVGVQDYEDFARTFAGIGKAVARRLSRRGRPLVHLTIAGADDIPIAPTSDLFRRLQEALVRYGDQALPVQLALRERIVLVISAGVAIHPDYIWEKVEPEIRRRLLERFSFDKRALGQDALLSEVFAVAQGVPGVEYIDMDSFGGVSELVDDALAEGGRRIRTPDEFAVEVQRIAGRRPEPRVRAALTAVASAGAIRPAQIALLLPDAPDTLILRRLAL